MLFCVCFGFVCGLYLCFCFCVYGVPLFLFVCCVFFLSLFFWFLTVVECFCPFILDVNDLMGALRWNIYNMHGHSLSCWAAKQNEQFQTTRNIKNATKQKKGARHIRKSKNSRNTEHTNPKQTQTTPFLIIQHQPFYLPQKSELFSFLFTLHFFLFLKIFPHLFQYFLKSL